MGATGQAWGDKGHRKGAEIVHRMVLASGFTEGVQPGHL